MITVFKNKKPVILISLYLLCAIIPFLNTIFLVRLQDMFCFVDLLIHLVCFIMFIVFTIALIMRTESIGIRRSLPVLSFFVVLFFFLSYGFQLDLADWYFIKSREARLNNLVHEIHNYGKLYEVCDGQRSVYCVNGKNISKYEFMVEENEKRDAIAQLNETLDSLQINRDVYFKIMNELKELGLLEFCRYKREDEPNDKTIYFEIDGALGDYFGIAYSETGIHGKYCCIGELSKWVHITGNWYAIAG